MGAGEDEGNYDAVDIERCQLEIWPSATVSTDRHDFASSSKPPSGGHLVAERTVVEAPLRKQPEDGYVPSTTSGSTLIVSARPRATAGEWIELGAIRKNAPWKKVKIDSIDKSEKRRKESTIANVD